MNYFQIADNKNWRRSIERRLKSNGYNFFYDKKEKLFVITSTPSDSFRYLEALEDMLFPKKTKKRIIFFVACYLLELDENKRFSASPTEEKRSFLKLKYNIDISMNTLTKYEKFLKSEEILKESEKQIKNIWKSYKVDMICENLPEDIKEAEEELNTRVFERELHNEYIKKVMKEIYFCKREPDTPEKKKKLKKLENKRVYLMRTTPYMETKRVYVCKNFEISENKKVQEYFTDKMENYKNMITKEASKKQWEKYHYFMKPYTALEINYRHPDIKKILELSRKIVEEVRKKGLIND